MTTRWSFGSLSMYAKLTISCVWRKWVVLAYMPTMFCLHMFSMRAI